MKNEKIDVIGIVGGGQLAQMMIEPAKKIGKTVYILDPNMKCSASSGSDKLILGEFDNSQDLAKLSKVVDVITFDIEKVNFDCLQKLENQNVVIRPSASIMGMIQDKLLQKEALRKLGFPVGWFSRTFGEVKTDQKFPLIWKARRGGYDGRGVIKVSNKEEFLLLNSVSGFVEKMVDIDKELAIMVARDIFGNVELLPIAEVVMDEETHALKFCKVPANIKLEIQDQIAFIAVRLAEKLDYIGILGIEFFLTKKGQILINELSPRPHNSGHFSIEGCSVSQFEQHIRAISGLPVLPSELLFNSVSFNVFASDNKKRTDEIIEMLNVKDDGPIFRHNYLKTSSRGGRKIGHVTVLNNTLEAAEKVAFSIMSDFT